MRNRTLLVRLPVALVGACVLFVYPVITPVWAAPKPVAPKVQTTPAAGVDAAAVASTPAALDPATIRAERGPAVSSGPSPDKRRANPSTRPAVLTAELSRDRFAVAGVSWKQGVGGADPVVQIRLKEAGGWTDWEALDTGDGPDPNSPDAKKAGGRVSSEPIFSSAADAVQVRVDTLDGKTPDGLSVVTVDPGTSPADANLTGSPPASAKSAVTMPGIITRAQWGADESMRNCTATYSPTIKVGFVHHTVGSNSYSPSDSAAIVRGIYAYHVNGNGWCDVGYSFLVDRYGQIFEGRAGGIDKPVIGAHTGGFNYNSFAVSALGTFTSDSPPSPMLNSISSVLGWKLGMYGRNIHGTDVLTSAGGGTSKYAAGTPVSLNVVSGHRDVGLTECPGSVLYAQLPNLRNLAANYRNANYRPDSQMAFQANTSRLWTVGTVHNEDTGLGMAAATSPSLAIIDGGTGYQIAFQANTGKLWTTGTLGIKDLGAAMMPGTSPSVAIVNGGTGYQIAFQADTSRLWTVGALGTRDYGLGMMPGTSPSITAVNDGAGYQIAFQANTSRLWSVGSLGDRDLAWGMKSGTSPSIIGVNAGYQIAFQANTTNLWTAGALGTQDLRWGMMSGTSPSITGVNGGYQIAFQANTSSLWTAGALGTQDLRWGLMSGTSPSIAAVNDRSGYQIAFQANTTNLWTTGTLGTQDLRWGMRRESSPDS
ncbi:MAG: peptidoglycan recognition protein [Dermatophilaceae bacterium]